MPSFSTPLSGLNADSQDLSVISNNLANLNTVGFKAAVANFQDLFYQQIGTTAPATPWRSVWESRSAQSEAISLKAASKPRVFPPMWPFKAEAFSLWREWIASVHTAGNFSVAANGALTTRTGARAGLRSRQRGHQPNQTLARSRSQPAHKPAEANFECSPHAQSGFGNACGAEPGKPKDRRGHFAGHRPEDWQHAGLLGRTNTFTYTTLLNDTLNT